jgi:ABC-type uncharacterized transport system permease subunit
MNPSPLYNPAIAVALRVGLGAYVIYMARKFYEDPTSYFRKSARGLPDVPWLASLIRAMACFCLWGGCFIVATAIAVQILGLHGDLLAIALIAVAVVATYVLLPRQLDIPLESPSDGEDNRRLQ